MALEIPEGWGRGPLFLFGNSKQLLDGGVLSRMPVMGVWISLLVGVGWCFLVRKPSLKNTIQRLQVGKVWIFSEKTHYEFGRAGA